ncbi:predicted protein [Verticillium alfalfae VaMs.102]|uniref:Predicted protein n=1 Tax=Verticillium alfalfae (strain VaMs.102 / ATCC MYA-4576 / FGSC 10136) TaxID=526221 RepID=C9SPV0_VERA1|nr:predicted protein [Verticillium alfalfae VaMs.102]EEY20815.1 predicted protein [Verticillium alfalfae VaMs.102]
MAHQSSARPAVPPPSQAASNAAAALQGANLAFARTTAPRPIPPAKRVPPNGALYAAATASTRDRSRSRSPAPSQSRQTTGGTDGTTEHARWPRLASSPPPAARLSPSSAAKPTSYDTKSPSYIAATLAASRSASPSPNANTPVPGLPAVARRRTSVNSLSGGSSLDLPDTSSIAPTTNLISMFERRDDNGGDDDDDDVEPTKKKTPVRRPTAMRRVPQLRAMTPEREISPQGRRAPPVRDSASPATEETTPTARPKPRVKPKLRPMTPERKMSPDRREPGPYTPSFPRRHPAAASTSSLPLHSLSNAIMAGSLAAARLTPSNTGASGHSPAPPLPRRHHAKSPRLRQTLRQPPAQSDDEETRRKKKHHGSHSNKKHFHHEGARRRWREEITPRERKRYEAFWAINRALLHDKMPPGPRARRRRPTSFLNVVVREDFGARSAPCRDERVSGKFWGSSSSAKSAGAVAPRACWAKQEFRRRPVGSPTRGSRARKNPPPKRRPEGNHAIYCRGQ